MSTANGGKDKKSSGGGAAGLVIFLIIMVFSALAEDNGGSAAAVLSVIVILIVVIALCVAAAKKKKARAEKPAGSYAAARPAAQTAPVPVRPAAKAGNVSGHSHDRINGDFAVRGCSREEHMEIQLKNFLDAGIVDRREYAMLRERFRKELNESNNSLY